MNAAFFGNPSAYFGQYENTFKNPAIITETLAVLNNPVCDAEKLVQILEREPGISAKILRVANSAFYGNPKSISSLKAAVVRLGNQNIARIALATSLSTPATNVWMPFWSHSVAVSLLSRHIAEYMKIYSRQEQEEFFSMGLLHDIGVLVEISAGDFKALNEYTLVHECTLEDAERALLGFDHGQLGEVIAKKWGFPGDLLHAMAEHHRPDLTGDYSSKVIPVHLADMVCHGFKITISAHEKAPETDEKYLQDVRIPIEQLLVFGDWISQQRDNIQAYGSALTA